jgi:hypothetical protein
MITTQRRNFCALLVTMMLLTVGCSNASDTERLSLILADSSSTIMPLGWTLIRQAAVDPCTDGDELGFYHRYFVVSSTELTASSEAVELFVDAGWRTPVRRSESDDTKSGWTYELVKAFGDWEATITISRYASNGDQADRSTVGGSIAIGYPPTERCR